jgi:WD40 repeat protein
METPSSYDQANLRSIFFADYDGTETGYPSLWRQGVQLCERDAQTEPVEKADSSTQANSQATSSCQTEDMAPSMAAAMEQISKGGAVLTDDALGTFLQRVCPGVEQQLDRNLRETALNGYDVNWGGDDAALACIHELRFKGAKQAFIDEGGVSALSPESEEEVPSLPVSSISWNSNGWTVAVGFGGCQQGLGWSDQPSSIAVWNLARPLVNKEKPDHVLTSPSCVTSVAFHPEKPSILTAGTLSGQIFVWDLTGEGDEKLIGESVASSDKAHKEPVANVSWVYNIREQNHEVLTTAPDGMVLLWRINSMVQPHKRYTLHPDPSALRAQPKLKSANALGATTLALSKVEAGTFVIGTESGGVHRCFLHAGAGGAGAGAGAGAAAATAATTVDRSPVVFSYEPHAGVVHDIDFSAHHRNLFATTASDGAVRLYNMLQAKQLLELQPAAAGISRVRWSKVRPTRLVAAGLDGAIYIYDLHESKANARQVVKPLPAEAGAAVGGDADKMSPLCALELSGAKQEFLATGTQDGVVRIYSSGGEAVSLLDTAIQLGALETLVVTEDEE